MGDVRRLMHSVGNQIYLLKHTLRFGRFAVVFEGFCNHEERSTNDHNQYFGALVHTKSIAHFG